MTTATLKRGSDSVTVDIIGEAGNPAVAVDIGHPNLEMQPSGGKDPRFFDQWSVNKSYTIRGRLQGANAYSDAITLADIIKSSTDELRLDIDLPEHGENILVAPAAGQDAAVGFNYQAGQKQDVHVEMALSRISETRGSQVSISTPTDTGDGPIQLTDGNTTINMVAGVNVQRDVGRPNDTIRRAPRTYPTLTTKIKSTAERFELSYEVTQDATQTLNDIESLFTQRLGRTPLQLDFNGMFGLGSFSVVPDGQQAVRYLRRTAYTDNPNVPTLNLRRVLSA